MGGEKVPQVFSSVRFIFLKITTMDCAKEEKLVRELGRASFRFWVTNGRKLLSLYSSAL